MGNQTKKCEIHKYLGNMAASKIEVAEKKNSEISDQKYRKMFRTKRKKTMH